MVKPWTVEVVDIALVMTLWLIIKIPLEKINGFFISRTTMLSSKGVRNEHFVVLKKLAITSFRTRLLR